MPRRFKEIRAILTRFEVSQKNIGRKRGCFRLIYVHRFSPRNSVNIRFGYMYACQEWGMIGTTLNDLHIHSYNFPLMPGYRHDFLPGEHASIIWGINAGIGIRKVSECHYDLSGTESCHASETKLGWGGSTEPGLNIRFSPNFREFVKRNVRS